MDNRVFVIDGKVLFEPSLRELRPVDGESGRRVGLNYPASRCLEEIILKKGAIIDKEKLADKVWGSEGLVVSDNTVYQNISLVRKALSQFLISPDFIVTVPRKGFKLKRADSAALQVSNFREERKEREGYEEEDGTIQVEHGEGREYHNHDSDLQLDLGSKVLSRKMLLEFCKICVVFLIVFFGVVLFKYFSDNQYVDDYRTYPRSDGCTVYWSPGIDRELRDGLESKYLKGCKSNLYYYVSTFSGFGRVSIISCNRMLVDLSKKFCESRYYFEDGV